ncbi:MAG: hypothetical protein ACK4FM_00065 [Caldimicrobium sp.]
MPFIAFDCEGPLTLNDNAFEFTAHIIPKGNFFFTQISRFDDYLADIKKKPGYKAGDTLKLILPFLKLFGATNKLLEEFSEKTLIFLPQVEEVLPSLQRFLPTFIISTSYRPYLWALAKRLGFPMEFIFCTEVDFDKVKLSVEEMKLLEKLYNEIMNYPLIELPRDARTPEDLSPSLRRILDRLEEIFFEIIWNLNCGIFLREVNPVGGKEKERACQVIIETTGIPGSEGIYCGDSITDVEAFQLLAGLGGISISFNGNRYALRAAEFYTLSKSAHFFKDLIEAYLKKGKVGLESLYNNKEDYEFGRIPMEETALNLLIERSEAFRKKVRGEQIGALG